MYSLKKNTTTNPWLHILNDQVFTKSTTTNFTVEKRMKREMVLFITYLSFTAKEKNKAMKSTKQNAVKADYYHY